MHAIWHRTRGPFHCMHCRSHEWERYDCNRAGCLRCGVAHECAGNLVDSHCPLAHLDDGTVCCTVTGLCVPAVRYSPNEYIDHAGPESCAPASALAARSLAQASIHEEVIATVAWFLTGQQAERSKNEEISRVLQRARHALVRALKQHKMESRALPCLPTVLANALNALRPRRYTPATPELCQTCAEGVEICLRDIQAPSTPAHRTNLVVGLLYLMKQGLVLNNTQWLPRVHLLRYCLPHENCLERCFGLSMKLICETENEIKLALRQRIKRL